jgi:anaerobic ribonucleoside-triphosphate reductase
MSVVKRDNSIVEFNINKIIDAINKAFIEVDGKLYENDTATDIANEISKQITADSTDVSVETI